MEARPRSRFDAQGLVVATADGGTRAVPFYAGAMHYWRVPAAQWAACLRQVHAIGLTLVETYVPWRVHEAAPGQFDWSGDRDLARFVRAAASAGLGVVLRPGPHVNAELTSFGFPDHVLADEAVRARTAHDTPVWMPSPPRAWPVPSYASRAFHAHVRRWYAEVARVVAPLVAPAGPVVALGVDNEAQMFFRLGAFDHDYHPDAVAWWREATGASGEPPRAWQPDDVARCIGWVKFKPTYLARALGEFAAILDDVGLGDVARYHNLPPGHFGLSDARQIQEAIGGPVGIDAYTPRADFAELRRRGLACVGAASPLPLAPEVGVGFFPWFPPLDPPDTAVDALRERDQLLTLLAAGIRGFELFMAVERDRYYGAAIDRSGQVAKHAGWIAKLTAALAEVEWTTLRHHRTIALVDTRADARFGDATNVLDPVTPVLAEALGIPAAELGTDAGAIASRRWQRAIVRALELAQVSFAIVDEQATEAELAGYRAVIVPTIERVDRALWQRLRALVEHKKTVCVIGPGTPTRDELDRPLGGDPNSAPASGGAARSGNAGPCDPNSAPASGGAARSGNAGPCDPNSAPASGGAARSGNAGPCDPNSAPASGGAARSGNAGPCDPNSAPASGGAARSGNAGPCDPPRRLGRIREGSLDDLAGLADDLAGLAGELADAWQVERPDTARATAFVDPAGRARVAFVYSDAERATTAIVYADGNALRDPFTGERIAVREGRATIALHPRGIRMFVVE